MNTQLRFIDLFAGIGGFRIALENLGMKCVFSSEINPSARKVYEKNFGEAPAGDITKIPPNEIVDFDILTGGFPCQPFSLNGKKEGFEDKTRGTLFFNIAEIISVKKPEIVFLENVKGIVTHDGGKTINTVLDTFKNLGYFTHTKVLNTYDFGIPQYRERWYCVAFRKDIEFHFPEGKAGGTTLADVLDIDHVDERLNLPQVELDRIEHHFREHHITARVQHDNSHCHPKSKAGKYGIFSYLKPDNSLRFHMGDVAKSQIQDDYYVSVKGIAPTLIATRAPKLWDLRRRLSVDECKKLQAFPEHYDFSDVSIQTAKKQLGNAITVKVVEEIARNILHYYQANITRKDEVKKKQLELI
jgi:DNA (cytosine-5)-methyltransferase 1